MTSQGEEGVNTKSECGGKLAESQGRRYLTMRVWGMCYLNPRYY